MKLKKIKVLLTLILLINSCNFTDFKNKFSKNDVKYQEPEIRLVSVDGQYRPVEKRTPKLNAQLQQQKKVEEYYKNNPEKENPYIVRDNKLIKNQEKKEERLGTQIREDFGPSEEPLVENAQMANAQDEAQIQYDLEKSRSIKAQEEAEKEAQTEEKKQIVIYKTKKDASVKGIFVQIGSYLSQNSAQKILEKGKRIASGSIKEVVVKGKKMHKILLGPVPDKREASKLLKEVKNNGFKDAFITRIK